MELDKLLYGIKCLEIFGVAPKNIDGIQFDSRKVRKNEIFVAVPGTQVDGHQYIDSTIKQGASVIICERIPEDLHEDVHYIKVSDSSYALGILASNFYDNPSQKLKLIGITGTNGKTSTVTMLFNLYRSLGYSVGLLSTVKNQIDNDEIAATHTTPDAIKINELMNEMVVAGCSYCFMEVSSHALAQNRTAGLTFAGGIFSNITHDHLDFHKTFAEYIKAKKIFFDNLPKEGFALINKDDKNGMVMVQNTKAKVKTYSIQTIADYRAKIIDNSFEGLHLEIDGNEIWVPLVGSFNAHNLLAVYGTAMELGSEKTEVLQSLSVIQTAEGRFDPIRSKEGIVGIIDYAHTPDALKNVLNTINDIRTGNEQLITVVGAGGNRDKTKRPEMAALASELSTRVILTSDNPRDEEPDDIIKDMEAGVSIEYKSRVISITNRREAIKTATALAQKGDIILLAGKGHEKYQEVKGIRHHFDDKEELSKLLNII